MFRNFYELKLNPEAMFRNCVRKDLYQYFFLTVLFRTYVNTRSKIHSNQKAQSREKQIVKPTQQAANACNMCTAYHGNFTVQWRVPTSRTCLAFLWNLVTIKGCGQNF
ncbi:unnamed protein product [Ixodes pacificus]